MIHTQDKWQSSTDIRGKISPWTWWRKCDWWP